MDQAVDVMAHEFAPLEKGLCELLHGAPDGHQQAFRLLTIGCVELFGRAAQAEELRDPRKLFPSAAGGPEPSIPSQFSLDIGSFESPLSRRRFRGRRPVFPARLRPVHRVAGPEEADNPSVEANQRM